MKMSALTDILLILRLVLVLTNVHRTITSNYKIGILIQYALRNVLRAMHMTIYSNAFLIALVGTSNKLIPLTIMSQSVWTYASLVSMETLKLDHAQIVAPFLSMETQTIGFVLIPVQIPLNLCKLEYQIYGGVV